MLGNFVAMLAHAKGAAVAVVFIAGAATATVGVTTNAQVQDTISNVTTSLGTTLSAVTQNAARSCTNSDEDKGGQPEVVAQRNAADKLLRDAWNDDHKKLVSLRGGKDVDNKAVGDIVKTYDDKLKDTLDAALVKVAALTLGRDGQVRKAEASATASGSGSPQPSDSPKTSASPASASPKPSCSPKPSDSAAAATTKPSASPNTSESPKASGSGKPED